MTQQDAEQRAREAGNPLGAWRQSRDLPHLAYAYSQEERPEGGSVAVGIYNAATGQVSLSLNGVWMGGGER